MGWETRHDGHTRAYYRKKRIGGRVVSEYCGLGEVAHAIAQIEETDRNLHALLRMQAHLERDAEDALDKQLDALEQEMATLTTGTLLAAGYRQHKGQWRKARS